MHMGNLMAVLKGNALKFRYKVFIRLSRGWLKWNNTVSNKSFIKAVSLEMLYVREMSFFFKKE